MGLYSLVAKVKGITSVTVIPLFICGGSALSVVTCRLLSSFGRGLLLPVVVGVSSQLKAPLMVKSSSKLCWVWPLSGCDVKGLFSSCNV